MRLNECVLICTNSDGTKRVWLYDLDPTGQTPSRTWRVRVWPQDMVTPDDGGRHFRLLVSELDDASAQIEYEPTAESQLIGDWERSVIATALYAVLARRLNKRLISCAPSLAFKYLTSVNEAEETQSGTFAVEGRLGRARPTQFGPLPERPAPTSEAQFQSLMAEVDNRMQKQQVPITGRQLVARAEISKILASQLSGNYPKRDPAPGIYEGDDFLIRVDQWIDEKYGERLLVDFSRGRVAVLLRGAIWGFKLPWLLGRFRLMASRTIPSDEVEMREYRADDPEEAKRPIPRHNVLDSLVALPDALRHDLSDDELRELLFAFETGIHAFEALRAIPQVPFIREAIADHLSSADHLSAPSSGHPGLAKWAALQAVEKTYKGFLAMNHTKIPKTHEIGKLSKLAATFGLHPADAKLIAAVECDPSVRYGETSVSLQDAVAAHHAALDLSWYVAEEIKGKPVSAT
jgi:hypothetical protein